MAVAALTVGGMALVATPASAASYNGNCEPSAYTLDSNGEFCFYYSPDRFGSLWDRSFALGGDADLGNDSFVSQGPGQGGVVRNNAASAWNRFRGESVYVHRYTDYVGYAVFVGSTSWTNLGELRNDQASYRWVE